jgi:hypothetical protein
VSLRYGHTLAILNIPGPPADCRFNYARCDRSYMGL